MAAAAMAVASLLVIIAYAAERSDLARAGEALQTLLRPAGERSSMWRAMGRDVAGLAVALLVGASCWGLGRCAGRLVPAAGESTVQREAACFALGSWLASVILFLAGHGHLLTPYVAWGLVVAGLGLGVIQCGVGRFRRGGRSDRRGKGDLVGPSPADESRTDVPYRPLRVNGPVLGMLAAFAVIAICLLAIGLAPPTARDALAYHLAVPKAYIAANEIIELSNCVMSYYPFGAEMLYTWVLLLGPDSAAGPLHSLYLVAVCLVIGGTVSRLTESGHWGLLAALVFAATPSVTANAGIAHNELMVTLAIVLAGCYLADWCENGQAGALIWFSVCYGYSLSLKHTFLVIGPVFTLVVLMRAARLLGSARWRTVAAGAAACAAAPLLAFPWYLQNVLRTGNPVFPFFWDLFPTHSAAWDAERANALEVFLRELYGQHDGFLDALALPWRVSVLAAEDDPRLYDGVLGPAFLILAPFAIALAIRGSIRWRIVGLVAAIGLVAWASQSQQLRFLLPLMPFVAILGTAGLARLFPVRQWRALALTTLVALAFVLAINVAVIATRTVEDGSIRAVLGVDSRREYLAARLIYYPFYDVLELVVPPDGKVMLIDMRNDTYYLNVPSYSDSFIEDHTIGRIVNESMSPTEIADRLRGMGITHLLLRNDILLGTATSPFETPLAAERWRTFVERHCRVLRRAGPIDLLALS
jgi:hypothetical protein